jgi:hypothetical protein
MKIRLHGTAEDCEQAVRRLATVFKLEEISEPYPDRGRSVLVRVYLTARLHGHGTSLTTAAPDSTEPEPAGR